MIFIADSHNVIHSSLTAGCIGLKKKGAVAKPPS